MIASFFASQRERQTDKQKNRRIGHVSLPDLVLVPSVTQFRVIMHAYYVVRSHHCTDWGLNELTDEIDFTTSLLLLLSECTIPMYKLCFLSCSASIDSTKLNQCVQGYIYFFSQVWCYDQQKQPATSPARYGRAGS